MYMCMYVCPSRPNNSEAIFRSNFLSVRSTQFPFKLNILFIKKYINLLGPKTLRINNNKQRVDFYFNFSETFCFFFVVVKPHFQEKIKRCQIFFYKILTLLEEISLGILISLGTFSVWQTDWKKCPSEWRNHVK